MATAVNTTSTPISTITTELNANELSLNSESQAKKIMDQVKNKTK
jgi:hypothetical protein